VKNAEANRRLKARGFGKVAEVYFPEYGCAGRGSRNTKVAIVALYDFSIAKWVTNAVLWDANRRLVEQVEAWFPEVKEAGHAVEA